MLKFKKLCPSTIVTSYISIVIFHRDFFLRFNLREVVINLITSFFMLKYVKIFFYPKYCGIFTS